MDLNKFRYHDQDLSRVIAFQPCLDSIELGTCDFDTNKHLTISGMKAFNIARDLIAAGVKRVIIGSVIVRMKKYNLPFVQFNEKASDYSAFMLGCLTNEGNRKGQHQSTSGPQ